MFFLFFAFLIQYSSASSRFAMGSWGPLAIIPGSPTLHIQRAPLHYSAIILLLRGMHSHTKYLEGLLC